MGLMDTGSRVTTHVPEPEPEPEEEKPPVVHMKVDGEAQAQANEFLELRDKIERDRAEFDRMRVCSGVPPPLPTPSPPHPSQPTAPPPRCPCNLCVQQLCNVLPCSSFVLQRCSDVLACTPPPPTRQPALE